LKSFHDYMIGDTIKVEGKTYTLTKKEEFYINGIKAFKLTLFSETQTIFLEIKRELALNYQIFKYSLLESIQNSGHFLSILGTNTLGYKNEKLSKSNVFKKVKIKKERYDLFKHIVTEDELPEDYQQKGYYKDENGNFYFFAKRYSPAIKELNSEKRLSWEYKQDNNLRLLIETKKEPNSMIYLYKGKELKPSEISVISNSHLKTSLPQEMNQIQGTLRHH